MKGLNDLFINNDEIKNIYLKNKSAKSNKWMEDLFGRLSFLVKGKVNKSKKNFSKEDLRQELNLQLWIAIKSFDCHKNFDFYRWANWHLLNAIKASKKQDLSNNSINLFIESTPEQIEKRLENMTLLKKIFENKKLLSSREKKIVLSYYLEEKTLKEISLDLQLSSERVRQIRDIALLRIKKYFKEI